MDAPMTHQHIKGYSLMALFNNNSQVRNNRPSNRKEEKNMTVDKDPDDITITIVVQNTSSQVSNWDVISGQQLASLTEIIKTISCLVHDFL